MEFPESTDEGEEEGEEEGKEGHAGILSELELHDEHSERHTGGESADPHPPECLLVGRDWVVEGVHLLFVPVTR